MNKRSKYIRDHYKLEKTSTGWRATSKHGGIDPQTGRHWNSKSEITGSTCDDVRRNARIEWGHFNFEDESMAFNEIFDCNRKNLGGFSGCGKRRRRRGKK